MQVMATAGHVDHGKSTLVRSLTGTEPDRLADERRRGLTIELGYCWTQLDENTTVAFIDVPGHEKFISTMLAGVAIVPTCLFVVAADDGWMPQAQEHLAALNALGVTQGVGVVTRSDLADPQAAAHRLRQKLDMTSLAGAPIVHVSGHTGAGVGALRDRIGAIASHLPRPNPDAHIRLWVDRRFTVHGRGTVVTGTLAAGTVNVDDELATADGRVRVRGVQALNRPCQRVTGVARVALNITGDVDQVARGDVLWEPDRWHLTQQVDVQLRADSFQPRIDTVPREPVLHMGAAAIGVRARRLDANHYRLTLNRSLPLRPGDRALLRDPGDRHVWGIDVLDPIPTGLNFRGAAQKRAIELSEVRAVPDLASELQRRNIVHSSTLAKLGIDAHNIAEAGVTASGWVLGPGYAEKLRAELQHRVTEHDAANSIATGMSVHELAEQLMLPAIDVVYDYVEPPLTVHDGRVYSVQVDALPAALHQTLIALDERFAVDAFAAPTHDELTLLGLGSEELQAAVKAGRLLQVAPGIVVAADACQRACQNLDQLPQPFTTSQARQVLGTTRRVAIPLLEFMDRSHLTHRLSDNRRRLIGFS